MVVTEDDEDVLLSALVTPDTQPVSFVPTWMDSPEPMSSRSGLVPRLDGITLVVVIPDSESRLFDMTEANTDSDNADRQDTRMCDPVQADDELSDTLINALERDLEDNVSSASVDPLSRSVAWAVSVSRAPASAVHDGKVAEFAGRGVKRLRVVRRESQETTVPVVVSESPIRLIESAEFDVNRGREEEMRSPQSARDAFPGIPDMSMFEVFEPVVRETAIDEPHSTR